MDHLTPNFRPAKQRAGKSEIGCPAGPGELELVEGRKSRRGRGLAMQIVRRRVCEITDILRQYLPPSRNCKFVHEPIEYEPLNLNVFTRNYRFLRSKSICLTIDIIQLDMFFNRQPWKSISIFEITSLNIRRQVRHFFRRYFSLFVRKNFSNFFSKTLSIPVPSNSTRTWLKRARWIFQYSSRIS